MAHAASTPFTSQHGMMILRSAFADTQKITHLRIRGVVIQAGDRMTVDVRTDAHGNCAGTMSVGKGVARIVVTRRDAYIKGDHAFWTDAGGADAALLIRTLHGRWLKAKPDARIGALCTLGRTMVAKMMTGLPAPAGSVRVGGLSTIDGVTVVELTDLSGSSGGSLFVSVAAPHYIRRVIANDPALKGTLTLSGFDDRSPVTIPGPGESFSAD